MEKTRITKDLIDEWTGEAEDYFNAGSDEAEVRQILINYGCTPNLIHTIVRRAKSKVVAHHRRIGIRTVAIGVALAVGGGYVALLATGHIPLDDRLWYSLKGAIAGGVLGLFGMLYALLGMDKAITGSTVDVSLDQMDD